MTAESVMLKPGVLFQPTASGGILMDLQDDRFIALSPISSAIWRSLEAGEGITGAVERIREANGIDFARAAALLGRQLVRWEEARLVNAPTGVAVVIPRPKPVPSVRPAELSPERVREQQLDLVLAARLFAAEVQYRRALSRHGLARTLAQLQHEGGRTPKARQPRELTLRIVRSYYSLRRVFRQGLMASDCLYRSLALAAVLRRNGVEADLCIGIIDLPFSAHAWVEADGAVLNDMLSKRSEYTTIGRF